jgi:hypothetical protein
VTEIKSRSAVLSWKSAFAGNLPLQAITIQLTEHLPGRPPTQRNATLPSPTQSLCPITDLQPLSNYSLRLIASNQLGNSEPSLGLHFQTEEEGECRSPRRPTANYSLTITANYDLSFSLSPLISLSVLSPQYRTSFRSTSKRSLSQVDQLKSPGT